MKPRKTMERAKKLKTSGLKKKRLAAASLDEFMSQDLEDMESDNESENGDRPVNDRMEGDEADSDESDLDPEEHKKSLKNLEEIDPEFYSYLQQNDKNLLNFDSDDNDSSDVEAQRHIPSHDLEVASDESDFEVEDGEEESTDGPKKVNLQLLKQWQEEIQKDKSAKTIKKVVEAFHAALETVSESNKDRILNFKVDGAVVFNGVIQLCIMNLPIAFKKFLRMDSQSNVQAHKSKRFVKIRGILKSYLTDLIKILESVSSANILTVLLKHLHQMLPFTQSFSSLTKPLLRVLMKFWSTGEETVRVVAFVNIIYIATHQQGTILETLLKAMYVKYVENSKFVSPNTLPGINFMRHSLAEVYLLDHNLSYNHAFLYIRQLAIHLRNAMTLKKKEHFQAVYNWQYINSLKFWVEFIILAKSQSAVRSLLYPLVQIITTTIKVIPTAQYYPLRFHCVQMLMNLAKDTNTFIPVLPFLLEVLNSYDFNKKHKTVSMKPLPLICVLRMSKSQLQENGFKDSIIDTIYQLILENAAQDSYKIYFPDLYIPCIIQLKAFLKKCKNPNYCKKIKQLLEKITENRTYIETERAKIVVDLKNVNEIANWETRVKQQGTNIAKFYDSWIKIHQSQKLKLLTKNDEMAEINVPTIKRSKKNKLTAESDDDSDESEFELRLKESDGAPVAEKLTKPKKKKQKMEKKIISASDDEPTVEKADIVHDINSADWD